MERRGGDEAATRSPRAQAQITVTFTIWAILFLTAIVGTPSGDLRSGDEDIRGGGRGELVFLVINLAVRVAIVALAARQQVHDEISPCDETPGRGRRRSCRPQAGRRRRRSRRPFDASRASVGRNPTARTWVSRVGVELGHGLGFGDPVAFGDHLGGHASEWAIEQVGAFAHVGSPRVRRMMRRAAFAVRSCSAPAAMLSAAPCRTWNNSTAVGSTSTGAKAPSRRPA
jgi:hypothetical protein